jgi:gamma-glutamyltranspeptidase/glutathione hydrolase
MRQQSSPRRAAIHSPHGLVAAQHHLAAQAGGQPTLPIGAAGGRAVVPALVQIVFDLADAGLSLEEALRLPRAARDVAARVTAAFPVDMVEDTLAPTPFGIPTAARRGPGGAIGMVHPAGPHATVAPGDPALAA